GGGHSDACGCASDSDRRAWWRSVGVTLAYARYASVKILLNDRVSLPVVTGRRCSSSIPVVACPRAMLKSVLIHNYRCFAEFEVELPRRLLIVGSNGSGKTSLWEALAGLQDVVVRGVEVERVFPTRSLTRWLPDDHVQRFAIDLQLGAEEYRYEIEIAHDLVPRVPTPLPEH